MKNAFVESEFKAIKTEEEYEETLRRITEMVDAEPGSPEGDVLELLTMLIEAYEARN